MVQGKTRPQIMLEEERPTPDNRAQDYYILGFILFFTKMEEVDDQETKEMIQLRLDELTQKQEEMLKK